MRKLLITTAILAFAGTAQAECPASMNPTECVFREAERSFAFDEKIKLEFKDISGQLVAVLSDRGNLLASNPHWKRPGAPKAFLYQATPTGQLPACNSAEVMMVLSRVANRHLGWMVYPKTLGGNENKNFCSIYLDAFVRTNLGRSDESYQSNYTVEWMDRSKGTFWVQIQ